VHVSASAITALRSTNTSAGITTGVHLYLLLGCYHGAAAARTLLNCLQTQRAYHSKPIAETRCRHVTNNPSIPASRIPQFLGHKQPSTPAVLRTPNKCLWPPASLSPCLFKQCAVQQDHHNPRNTDKVPNGMLQRNSPSHKPKHPGTHCIAAAALACCRLGHQRATLEQTTTCAHTSHMHKHSSRVPLAADIIAAGFTTPDTWLY
jgi:hypothetical protein